MDHFWLVKPRPGGIEVPVLKAEVARTFAERGWEVTLLPLAALTEADLRCLRVGGMVKRK